MNEDVLGEIGLSKNEAKVYLALLELGSATVGNISKKSKVHRTNVYDSLTKLESKNLVNCIEKDGTKYFNARDPKEIMNLIKEKEER